MVDNKPTRGQGGVYCVVNQQGTVWLVVNQHGDRATTVKRPVFSGAALTFRKVNSVNRMFGNTVVQGRP